MEKTKPYKEKDSEGCHSRMTIDAKELSTETKMAQLKERSSLMLKLLQERVEEE